LAFIYFLFLSLVLSIWAAFDERATWLALIFFTLAIFFVARSLTSTITFDGNTLKIDKAQIESQYLGEVTVLDSQELRLVRTREADPAAYLAIRFWMSTGIKVALNDPRDSTPYWLITSKRGEELAALLTEKKN
jgi:hypothetical protein